MSCMDLVNAVSGMQQAKVMAKVQYAVAGKILDMQKFQGNAAIKLIESASAGANQAGDELVAAATGLGGSLDVFA
jgi:hypothetical protein